MPANGACPPRVCRRTGQGIPREAASRWFSSLALSVVLFTVSCARWAMAGCFTVLPGARTGTTVTTPDTLHAGVVVDGPAVPGPREHLREPDGETRRRCRSCKAEKQAKLEAEQRRSSRRLQQTADGAARRCSTLQEHLQAAVDGGEGDHQWGNVLTTGATHSDASTRASTRRGWPSACR
jgi:hypothetical protein